MPTLRNPKHEIFAQGLAKGLTALDAYTEAGFKPDRRNARALANKPHIERRVSELLERRRMVEDQAIERLAISKEAAAHELALLGFARMGDYLRQDGDSLSLDIEGLAPERLAAIQKCTVETYVEGKGDDARRVKRVRIDLYDKRQAIMDLARLMGWVIEKKDQVLRIEERLATMTPEELDEDARQLALRARRLLEEKQAEREPRSRGGADGYR